MIKRLILFFFILLSVPVLAQEHYFQEAIRRGLKPNGYYCIENTAKRDITVKELQSYADSKGYIVGRIATTNLYKFGDSKIIAYKFEFKLKEESKTIAPKNYDEYVYGFLKGTKGGLSIPGGMGAAYMHYLDNKSETNVDPLITISIKGRKKLKYVDNIHWTGSIMNGLLHGSGSGFMFWDGYYCLFYGNFSHGFPTENISVKAVWGKNKEALNNLSSDDVRAKVIYIVKPQELSGATTDNDPKLRQAARGRLSECCTADKAQLEESFRKARAINISNYSNHTDDYFPKSFCDIYDNIADATTMAKARELRDFNKVLNVLNMIIAPFYDETGVFTQLFGGYKTEWLQKAWDDQNARINEATSACNKLKTSSKYGFKTFFAQAAPLVAKQRQKFDAETRKSRAEYDKIHQQEYEKRKRRAEELQKIDQKLSTEIDWDRSKSPSGELTSTILETCDYYQEPGVIRFKAGVEYVNYNEFYYRDKLDHYGITHASSKIERNLRKREFKTYGELLEAVTNAAK